MAEKPSKLTFEQLKARKKPNHKTLPVCLDPALGRRYQDAVEKKNLAEVRMNMAEPKSKERADLAKELSKQEALVEELFPQVEEVTYNFEFESINPTLLDDILTENPPTKDQLDKARIAGTTIAWNPKTVPPILVAESLVDPEISVEEMQELWDDPNWNNAELGELFNTAMEVNSQFINVNLKKE